MIKREQLVVVTMIASLSGACVAQSQQPDSVPAGSRPRRTAADAARLIDQSFLQPVVATLKFRTAKVGLTLRPLERIRMRVNYSRKRAYNAWSYDRSGEAQIDIDLLFAVEQVMPFAMYAAAAQVLSSDTDLLARVSLDHADSLLQAQREGRRPPSFAFVPEEHGASATLAAVIVELGQEITRQFFAFWILHEMGHIELGHLQPEKAPTSAAQGKAQELQADQWAFGAMRRLDYSLELLSAALTAKYLIQAVRVAAGVEGPTPEYPNWGDRSAALSQFKASNPPRPVAVRRLVTFAHLGAEGVSKGGSTQLLVTAPAADKISAAVGLTSFYDASGKRHSGIVNGMAAERDPLTTVYFREGNERLELAFPTHLGDEVVISLREVDQTGKVKRVVSIPAIYTGSASHAGVDSPYGRLEEIMTFRLTDFYERFLTSRSAASSMRDSVRSALLAMTHNHRIISLGYYTGLLSKEKTAESLRLNNELLRLRLRRFLGPSLLEDSKGELGKLADGELLRDLFPDR